MGGFGGDIKFAIRQAGRYPGLVLLITIILGIGIGATTTIFAVSKAPFNVPVLEPTQLLFLWSTNPQRSIDRSPMSRGYFADLKSTLRSVENLAAYSDESVHMTGATEPTRLLARRATTNIFSVLGVKPIIGRGFAADEFDQTEGVAVLTYSTWQATFGGDTGILERTIEIDGLAHRIIGVLPELGIFSYGVGLWRPMRNPRGSDLRTVRDLTVFGRAAPEVGVTASVFPFVDPRPRAPEVQAELSVLAKQFADAHPETDRDWEIAFTGMVPMRTSEVVASNLFLLMPLIVLAIACANIANLLLARAVGRKRDIAVRIALGASRFRIVRLVMIENILHALAGAVLGVALGVWGTDLLRRIDVTPFWSTARVDFWTLGASLLVAVLSALLFGMAPASQTLRLGIGESLKQAGPNTIDKKGHRLRNILMTGEVAAATLLLLVVVLTARSALHLNALELGFDVDQVLTFRLEVPEYRYSDLDSVAQTHLRIAESLRRLPGVTFAGLGTRVPTAGSRNNHTEQLTIAGRERVAGRDGDWAVDLTVSEGYFEALGIPLLSGRSFVSADTVSGQPVALVSKAMADRYWPGADVTGASVRLSNRGPDAPWITIIGVVADVRNDNAAEPPLPMLYFPIAQNPIRTATYVIHTSRNMEAATATVRTAVRTQEPGLPLFDVQTMKQVVDNDLYGSWFTVEMLTAFAGLALFLAMTGLFGVLSQLTSECSTEIAIRIALGAMPRQVALAFVGRGLRIAVYGVLLGIVAGLLVSPVLGSLLFGVQTTDPVSFTLVTIGVLIVAACACYLPARRASRRDPMPLLRAE